jgi:hypothetical protein
VFLAQVIGVRFSECGQWTYHRGGLAVDVRQSGNGGLYATRPGTPTDMPHIADTSRRWPDNRASWLGRPRVSDSGPAAPVWTRLRRP